ncbi:response regulator [Candidatus Woesearchaeota archaeon]|nr:response regulator [Candidatus Woesearchaeota archaeon]
MAAKGKKATKVIFLVDDEVSVLQLVRKILEEEGYSVDAATSGEDALSKLRDIKPDLMVLDMMMPGKSGLETCQRIRQVPEWADIKVMFLTVMRKTKEVEAQMKELGITDYIEKPFRVEDLLKRVRKALS